MSRYGCAASVQEEGEDKGRLVPKFGEWDVNDPSSAEGFTVIFNKGRNEKKALVVAYLMNLLDLIKMPMFLASPL